MVVAAACVGETLRVLGHRHGVLRWCLILAGLLLLLVLNRLLGRRRVGEMVEAAVQQLRGQ